MKNAFLKDLHVLDPVSRTEPDAADTMIRVAKAVPKLLSDVEIDRIRYEYIMCTAENIDESWHIKNNYQDSDNDNCNDKKMEFVDVLMMFIDKLEGAAYRHPR